MMKRWVKSIAVVGMMAVAADQRTLSAQPAPVVAPAAAVPAWIPPPAPAQPTLWRFLGIPQGFQRMADARLNRNGNFPGLERKPPLKPIAHPDNLLSNNPAIKKAAEIKMQEDLAKQKIKAIKYLAKLGCDKCYGGVKEALMAALDDCTEQVRYEAAKAIGEAAVQHCETCSRQCCCDEELTKKLAQIVYEKDDKCCWLEPSERVRNAAKEALQACCPNVGPPPVPEVIEQPEVPPEVPPERPPETPPETPPELPPPGLNGAAPLPGGVAPPPPGRNGVAPRTNGEVTPRPTLPPEESTQNFLRSRADRMAATAQVRRAPTVQRAITRGQTNVPKQPVIELPVPQQAVAQPPAARLVISDSTPPVLNSDRRPTIEKSTKLRSEEPADASALRIRISDMPDNEHASLPAPIPANSRTMKSLSTGEGSVVRIRDRSDELQLASAHEAAPVASASSRRSQQVIVSDLFAPPPGERTPVAANAMPQKAASAPQASAVVTNVQSVRSQGDSVKAMGRVSDIDSRSGSIRFTFKTEQAPAKGALVKVYHHFLLGQECTGALEITGVQKGVATARPVGNLNINKISLDDEVAFQSAAFVPTVQPAAVIASDTP